MLFLKNKGLVFLAILLIPAFYYDKTIMLWIKAHRAFLSEDWYEPIDYLVKYSSHGTTLIVLSLLVFLVTKPYRRTLSNTAKALFIGLVTAGIAVQGFKHITGRARPRVTFDTVFIGPSMSFSYDSFPSGHTTLVFCLALMLSRHYPRYTVPLYLFAIVAAADRILWLSHFPSDIVAGVMLGTVVGHLVSERDTTRAKAPDCIPGK